jgi:hypothetical protein
VIGWFFNVLRGISAGEEFEFWEKEIKMRITSKFHPLKLLTALGYFLGVYCLAFAMIMGMTPATVSYAQSGSGAIWTTLDTCGEPEQNVNHYEVGDVVYVNASNFDPNEFMAWDITRVSGNPKETVAVGTVTADGNGGFCIAAYTVSPTTPTGTYQVTVGEVKSDNFRIQAEDPTPTNTVLPPTNTPLPTDIPTNTPVPPTDIPTNTPIPPTNTPLPTDEPTNTPLPPSNTPESTATLIPPTSTTEPQPTEISPTSPAPTSTPDPTEPPTAPTNPPPPLPTDVPAPVPTSPAVLIPVTGINVGGSRVLMEGLLYDLGIGFLGFGLLMHGVWFRFGKKESGLMIWEDPRT